MQLHAPYKRRPGSTGYCGVLSRFKKLFEHLVKLTQDKLSTLDTVKTLKTEKASLDPKGTQTSPKTGNRADGNWREGQWLQDSQSFYWQSSVQRGG